MASVKSHDSEYLYQELSEAGIKPRDCICSFSESGRAKCRRMMRDMSQYPSLHHRCGYVSVPKTPRAETRQKRRASAEALAQARLHRRTCFGVHLGAAATSALAAGDSAFVALWHFHPSVTAAGETTNRGFELPSSIDQATARAINDEGFSYTGRDRVPGFNPKMPTYAPVPNYTHAAQRRDVDMARDAAGQPPPPPPPSTSSSSSSSSSAAASSSSSSSSAASSSSSGPCHGPPTPSTHTIAVDSVLFEATGATKP